MTVSCGVAERQRNDPTEHWFEMVDKSLYRAKFKGRNRVELWDSDVKEFFSMVQIFWNPEWNSGNSTIDREHRELLHRGNQLLNMSLNGTDIDSMRPLLEELIVHIRSHFSHEEDILRDSEYPDLPNHRKIHSALLSEAEMLYDNYRDHIIKPSLLFHLLVDRILMEHLLMVDKEYFAHLRRRGMSV